LSAAVVREMKKLYSFFTARTTAAEIKNRLLLGCIWLKLRFFAKGVTTLAENICARSHL